MSTKKYELNRSVIKENFSSVDDFIAAVKNFIAPTVPPQLPATQSPIQIQPSQSVNTSTCSPATNSQNQVHSSESIRSLPCSPATQSQIQIQPSVSVTSPTCSPATQSQIHQSSSPLQRPSTSTKRSRILDANEQLSKRLKCIGDGIDEEIEKQRKGLCKSINYIVIHACHH